MANDSVKNEKIDEAYRIYADRHFDKGMKENVKILSAVLIGSLLITFNLAVMLPAGGMIAAGFSGIAMFVQKIADSFFGVKIPFAPISLLLNVIPAYLCFRYVGRKFTTFSCVSIVLVSVFADFFPKFSVTDDVLLIAVFGGILNGIGVALILNRGASSGGTDFLAMYFSVKKGVTVFNIVFLCNTVMILLYGLMFGMENALYTIIYQFVSTQTVNSLYKRYMKKTLFIVTKHPHDIADAIMAVTHHSCTVLNSAQGGYTGETQHIVYTVIGAKEVGQVMKLVRKEDSAAFVDVMNSDSVYGQFYLRPIS